jgi:hypothetical protein
MLLSLGVAIGIAHRSKDEKTFESIEAMLRNEVLTMDEDAMRKHTLGFDNYINQAISDAQDIREQGVMLADLESAGISVYESTDAPGYFGFTGCDSDNFASFEKALHAAWSANQDVGEVDSDNDSSSQPERANA